MMVYGLPSMVTRLPTTPGLLPNRRCHRAWLITATVSRPGVSSSDKNVRPSAGSTPGTANSRSVTSRPSSLRLAATA